MNSSPSPDLELLWRQAAHQLRADPEGTLRHVGMGARTLSGPVTTAEGTKAWLRVWSAPHPGGKLWDGPGLAERLLDSHVPAPALLAEVTWTEGVGTAVQAHLFEHLASGPVSATPVLHTPVELDERWWEDLAEALRSVRQVPADPDRQVMTQAYINRIPRFIPELDGEDLTVERWESAHGDLHWGNLASGPLQIIDWEGWGPAPAGYDAAVLHTYALPVPEIARRVRTEFADQLAGSTGRLAQLVIAAEVIQAAERDDVHSELEPYVRHHVRCLLKA